MPPRHPLLLIALAAVFFSVMAFATKLAAASLPAGEIAMIRFVVMLLPLLFVPRLARRALDFQRADLLFYRGVCGGTAVLLYFLAIAHIPVGLATLLNFTSPVFSVFFAALFLGEPVDRRLVPATGLALLGVALAAGGDRASGELLSIGIWECAALASAVLAGAAVTAIRAARRTESSWSIYASFSLFGLLSTAPFGLANLRAPTASEWSILAVVGTASVAAQLLMTYAYRWVTNLQAGAILQLTVVLTLLLGSLLLGDRLTRLQFVGCALALTGVVWVIRLQAPPRAVT